MLLLAILLEADSHLHIIPFCRKLVEPLNLEKCHFCDSVLSYDKDILADVIKVPNWLILRKQGGLQKLEDCS